MGCQMNEYDSNRIFDLTKLDYSLITLESGIPLFSEDGSFNIETSDSGDVQDFQLFNDAGLIRNVPYVEATVATWDLPERKLSVANVTDMNPEQINLTTGNVDINEFDVALVIGQTSGACWQSVTAGQKPKPFDDAADIQEEFNQIKVYDTADTNPFGFY